MAKAIMAIEVEYDPLATDAESLAGALDRLLETSMSTPGILDEYGGRTVTVGQFEVRSDGARAPGPCFTGTLRAEREVTVFAADFDEAAVEIMRMHEEGDAAAELGSATVVGVHLTDEDGRPLEGGRAMSDARGTYPRTVRVYGSWGEAEYCAVTGRAMAEPYTSDDFVLARIDLREYLQYWRLIDDEHGLSLEIDVMDVGGWTADGRWSPPEIVWRADSILDRERENGVYVEGNRCGELELRYSFVGDEMGDFEIVFTPVQVDMFLERGEPIVAARFDRLDHAFETAHWMSERLKAPVSVRPRR